MKPILAFVTNLLFLTATIAQTVPNPSWWSQGDPPPIDPNITIATNKMPCNLGQAKWMVVSAVNALQSTHPQLAAQIKIDLVPIFDIDTDLAAPRTEEWKLKQKQPLLIGQLKALAQPFYATLHIYDTPWLFAQLDRNQTRHPSDATFIYPWQETKPANGTNNSIATIGQLKATFALDFQSLPPEDPDADPDNDGYTNAEELLLGTNPYVANPELKADSDNDGIEDGYERLLIATSLTDPYVSLASISLSNVNNVGGLLGQNGNGPGGGSRFGNTGDETQLVDAPPINVWSEIQEISVNFAAFEGNLFVSSNPVGLVDQASIVGSDDESLGQIAQNAFSKVFPGDADAVNSENWETARDASTNEVTIADLVSNRFQNSGQFEASRLRIRLVADRKIEQGEQPYTQTFLKFRKDLVNDEVEFLELVELTIPEGKDHSQPVELNSELSRHEEILISLNLAVDANRNGTVEFGVDQTTPEEPYRFWINSDKDSGNGAKAKDEDPGAASIAKDSEDDDIHCLRDLEDFTQLVFDAGSITKLISSEAIEVGFRFVDVISGSPRIRIFHADGQGFGDSEFDGQAYLEDETAANQQMHFIESIQARVILIHCQRVSFQEICFLKLQRLTLM